MLHSEHLPDRFRRIAAMAAGRANRGDAALAGPVGDRSFRYLEQEGYLPSSQEPPFMLADELAAGKQLTQQLFPFLIMSCGGRAHAVSSPVDARVRIVPNPHTFHAKFGDASRRTSHRLRVVGTVTWSRARKCLLGCPHRRFASPPGRRSPPVRPRSRTGRDPALGRHAARRPARYGGRSAAGPDEFDRSFRERPPIRHSRQPEAASA